MSPPTLNLIEPPWYGPVCPVVWEGWHREVSPYPDQSGDTVEVGVVIHFRQEVICDAEDTFDRFA